MNHLMRCLCERRLLYPAILMMMAVPPVSACTTGGPRVGAAAGHGDSVVQGQVFPPSGGALPTRSPAERLILPHLDLPEFPEAVTLPPAMGAVTAPSDPQLPDGRVPVSPGVRNLTELALSQPPARRASLSLTQEARLAYLNQEPIAARDRLESALQLWGRNPYALYYLGLLELDDRNYAHARDYARTAINHVEGSPGWQARFYLLLAEAEAKLGNRSSAQAARRTALELDPHAVLR